MFHFSTAQPKWHRKIPPLNDTSSAKDSETFRQPHISERSLATGRARRSAHYMQGMVPENCADGMLRPHVVCPHSTQPETTLVLPIFEMDRQLNYIVRLIALQSYTAVIMGAMAKVKSLPYHTLPVWP
jgi:hypothetical protein